MLLCEARGVDSRLHFHLDFKVSFVLVERGHFQLDIKVSFVLVTCALSEAKAVGRYSLP
jgi:hypothetical protein